MPAIVDVLKHVITASVVGTAAGGGENRFEFRGPPLAIMRRLLEAFVAEGGLRLPSGATMPVLMLDSTVAKNPQGFSSGACTLPHVVTVRSSDQPYYLLLVPPGQETNKSVTSTTTTFGVENRDDDTTDWKWFDQPFVQELVGHAFEPAMPLVPMPRIIEAAFVDADQVDFTTAGRAHQWDLLEKLFLVTSADFSWDRLVAVIGLPRCAQGSEMIALDVLGDIASAIQDDGIGEAVGRWVARANELGLAPDVASALQELGDQLRGACSAPEFHQAPLYWYSPLRRRTPSEKIPTWWQVLDLDTWRQLFATDDAKQEALGITITNAALPGKVGPAFVVLDRAEFAIKAPARIVGVEVELRRGHTPRSTVTLGRITLHDGTATAVDEAPPAAARAHVYRAEPAPGNRVGPGKVSVVSLARFEPGAVFYVPAATKMSLPRKQKRRIQGRDAWVSDIHFPGPGTYQIDMLASPECVLPSEALVSTEESAGGPEKPDEFSLEVGFEGRRTLRIEIHEATYVDVEIETPAVKKVLLRAWCLLEGDEVLQGFDSEYERLIVANQPRSKAARAASIIPRWSFLDRLQSAIIKDERSYLPGIISTDFLDVFEQPDWTTPPNFSRLDFITDVRPAAVDFSPPSGLLAARKAIQELLRDKNVELLEAAHLGNLLGAAVPSNNKTLHDVVIDYVNEYASWVRADPSHAMWFDTIAYVVPEASGKVLGVTPHAVLLSPLHPLRLAWQCHAQSVLQAALDVGKPCAGASSLDPSAVPDCLELPVWAANQTVVETFFISLVSDASYWSILWNASLLNDLNVPAKTAIFGERLGLGIEGLASGLSKAQIERTLSTVSTIRAARNTLKVRLLTDTPGRSFCNDGVMSWTRANLGPFDADAETGDTWASAGARRVDLCDLRRPQEHPAPEELANLASDTDGAVKWFFKPTDTHAADVAVIGNLGMLNPLGVFEGIGSALGWGALSRKRVRRQYPGNRVIIETRCSNYRGPAAGDLATVLASTCEQVEKGASGNFDSLSFSANTAQLREQVKTSLYCAVSSGVADPATFFNIDDDAYLWDFDMPTYSAQSGPSHGYYLLAQQTPATIDAVLQTLGKAIPAAKKLDRDMVARLMREVSARGVPTLRKLAAGGIGATGEVGMLVALRLLLGQGSGSGQFQGLFKPSGTLVNLVIPVDPFEQPFNVLREGHVDSNVRADLLAASLSLSGSGAVALRLTPIEVKYRGYPMNGDQRRVALSQAKSFASFLKILASYRLDGDPATRLWCLAKCSLFADLLDFGFRIMANVSGSGWDKQRAELQAAALAAIMADTASIDIDLRGRLIVVDKSSESQSLDSDGDRFFETVSLSEEDAIGLLQDKPPAVVTKLAGILKDWELGAPTAPGHSPGSSGPPPPRPESGPSPQPPVPTSPPPPTSPLAPAAGRETPITATTAPPVQTVAAPESASPGPALAATASSTKGVWFPVGRDLNPLRGDDEFFFWPSNTALNQLNIGILGDLGTGKTQMVKALIYRIANAADGNRGTRPKFLILDYKGDYLDEEFRAAVGAKVFKPQHLPFNLFDLSAIAGKSLTPWLDRFNFFSDTLSKIHSVNAPVQKQKLKDAVRAAYDWARNNGAPAPTVYNVFDQYKALVGGTPDTTYAILSDLIDREVFERDHAKLQPFTELFDGVFVLDLKSLGADDKSKNMLVAIFLNVFYEYMLGVPKKPFLGDDPQLRSLDSMLLVDEADNIMKFDFDVLRSILLQGREFGVGVMLSSQYLSHFRTNTNYAEPLLTWLIHKVPNITLAELRSIGLKEKDVNIDTLESIKALKVHECFYKSLGVDGKFMRGYPFYSLAKKA